MGKYVTRIAHKGQQLLQMDTPGKTEEEGIVAWTEMKQELLKEQSACYILVDATGITMAPESVSRAKEAAAAMKENPDNRIAFVGMTGLQKSTAQLIAKGLRGTRARNGWSARPRRARNARPPCAMVL